MSPRPWSAGLPEAPGRPASAQSSSPAGTVGHAEALPDLRPLDRHRMASLGSLQDHDVPRCGGGERPGRDEIEVQTHTATCTSD